MPSFKLSKQVHMKDENLVKEKINKLLAAGPDKLQIVADFDFTITKNHENGTPNLSSFCIFEESKQLPSSYLKNSKAMLNKYRPIELDPSITKKEKIPLLEEWMRLVEELLKGIEFDRKELDELTAKHGHFLRDQTKELFQKLNSKNVPILIMSAGLGDMVESILKFHGVLFDNVHIVSNFLKFDKNTIQGFKGSREPLHVLNKNENAIDPAYFGKLKERTNIILMGDSLGDADMAEGAKHVDNVLKIGFLYHNVEKNVPLYEEAFDVVLVDDQTMHVVMEILSPIL